MDFKLFRELINLMATQLSSILKHFDIMKQAYYCFIYIRFRYEEKFKHARFCPQVSYGLRAMLVITKRFCRNDN